MKVYTLILNYNNYQDTIYLVNQIKQQKKIFPHIIIVDNCSPNQSYSALKDAFIDDVLVTVLDSGTNGGYSYGNNFGLKYINQFKPQNVFILNNDIIISDKYLFYNLILELEKNKKAFLCTPSMLINGKEQFIARKIPSIWDDIKRSTRLGQKLFGNRIFYRFKSKKETESVEIVPGSFFLCNYNKFKSIGFFDEDLFLFGEETILAYKIKQAGSINLLCRQYSYEHLWSKSINEEINKVKRIQLQLFGREVFHRKYNKPNLALYFLLKFLHKIRIVEEKIRVTILSILNHKQR